METLNFEIDKVQAINMQVLKKTYLETDCFGNPLKGIHHYTLLQQILQLASKYSLQPEIQDMFAADNRSKQFPGVTKLPLIEQNVGTNAVEAHVLRRIYCTINLQHRSTEELTTNIAIAYHQEGIQLAFGTTVKACRNLCLMGHGSFISNFGKEKVSNEELLQRVENWFANFTSNQEHDFYLIEKMQSVICDKSDALRLIGMLTAIRVAHDNNIGEMKEKISCYPLNQAQISQYTLDYLKLAEVQEVVTLWDLYNIATHLYKADKMEIPNILPQNYSIFQVLTDLFKL